MIATCICMADFSRAPRVEGLAACDAWGVLMSRSSPLLVPLSLRLAIRAFSRFSSVANVGARSPEGELVTPECGEVPGARGAGGAGAAAAAQQRATATATASADAAGDGDGEAVRAGGAAPRAVGPAPHGV